jgi:hypothetical protein
MIKRLDYLTTLLIKHYMKYLIAIILFIAFTILGIIVVDYNYNSFMGNKEKISVIKGLTYVEK